MGLTKLVFKRPVSTVLAILCLIVVRLILCDEITVGINDRI